MSAMTPVLLRRMARLIYWGLVCLGAVIFAEQSVAQTPTSVRLTVHPHDMAMGTQNPAAGHYTLAMHRVDVLDDSLDYTHLVYIPPKCAGRQRCPLVVYLHGAGRDGWQHALQYTRAPADRYGMLVLMVASSRRRYSWPQSRKDLTTDDVTDLDGALRRVLQRFVVDPDKIAIVGRCNGGPLALFFGLDNPAVFNRVAAVSGMLWTYRPSPGDVAGPPAEGVEFFFDGGLLSANEVGFNFRIAHQLQQTGHRVKQVTTLRAHEDQASAYDLLGHWLQESWATPDPAARPAPLGVAHADSLPALTPSALAKLAAFWANPNIARQTEAFLPSLREFVLPVGKMPPTVWMPDVTAVAVKDSSVAAALTVAGLTAEQVNAYGAALVSASFMNELVSTAVMTSGYDLFDRNVSLRFDWSVRSSSPRQDVQRLMANLAYVRTHEDEADRVLQLLRKVL